MVASFLSILRDKALPGSIPSI